METLAVAQGSFDLRRVPAQPTRPLRAWDAADEYVLTHLEEREGSSRSAIIGDAFGALSCGLHSHEIVVFVESATRRKALAENRARNGLDPLEAFSILDTSALQGRDVDTVIIKIPKSVSELTDVLHRVRPHLTPRTEILGAAMARHIRSSTVEQFETIIGPTTTSLAKKKARLIHSTFDPELDPGPNPWPAKWKAHGHLLITHGGGFSPTKLDQGTAFLLDSVDVSGLGLQSGGELSLADLGCGNGVIGLALSSRIEEQLGGACHVLAVDDSALAIDAAHASWAASSRDSVSFHHVDRLSAAAEAGSLDLVVVNPPFHDDRSLGDQVAWSMFVDAHKALRPGGQLLVVGNRHLGYHAKLSKIFGASETIGSNKKFVVLRSVRRT